MLDGINSRLGGPKDSLSAMCVRGDFASQAMCVGDDRLHLLKRELRSLRIVSFGEHAAGCADLHHVSAVLDHLARLVLHVLDAVGHAFRNLMIGVRKKIVVAMSAG